MKKIFYDINNQKAFTLAEVLITLGIIGIVAAMTLPTLIHKNQEKHFVTGLQKFSTTLQQSILLWKNEIGCFSDANTCLEQQALSDNVCANFDQISKYLNVISYKASWAGNVSWLPDQTFDYYGNNQTGIYGGVSNAASGTCKYALKDGTTMSLDPDATGFQMYVDVNGKKPPNRMGKDTFPFTIGKQTRKDLLYYPIQITAAVNTGGLCSSNCNPNNVDPTKNNGASVTAYVILNSKLPDFLALSQSVAGFKP